MKKLSLKKHRITLLLIGFFLVLALIISVSLAWFVKSTSDDEFNLSFAKVDLRVDNGYDAQTFEFNVKRLNESVKNSIIMPGDILTGNLRIKNVGDTDCYYLIKILTQNDILEDAENYFYIENENLIKANEDNIGSLAVSEEIITTINLDIKESLTNQNVLDNLNCCVVAIQKRNISVFEAFNELINL